MHSGQGVSPDSSAQEKERQRSQRRRMANPEGNRAYQRAWYHAHKEQARAYYLKNREKKIAAAAKWEKDNPERFKKRQLAYREKNREHLRATSREYSRTHKAENLKRLHLFHDRHPERRKEWDRRWSQANPVKRAMYSAKRRAVKMEVAINPEQIEAWMLRMRALGAPCYYCGVPVQGGDIDFDHIVPLARGGPHEISNLCVSCVPCNRRKHVKLISEWQRHPQQILSL